MCDERDKIFNDKQLAAMRDQFHLFFIPTQNTLLYSSSTHIFKIT